MTKIEKLLEEILAELRAIKISAQKTRSQTHKSVARLVSIENRIIDTQDIMTKGGKKPKTDNQKNIDRNLKHLTEVYLK